MLHEDDGTRAVGAERRDDRADVGGALRIEVRGRLVEQQQARTERDRAGDRQTLLLTAGERVGAAVGGIREAHRRERRVHPCPDLRGRHAAVLEPERDVVAGARHDELRLWILEHERGLGASLSRCVAAHQELALALAAAGAVEKTGERLEQRALARAGRAEQQDALAFLDAQIEPAYRPRPPAGVAPAPTARADRRSGQG